MSDIAFTVTNAGRAAIVAAGTNGTLPVQIVSMGVSPTAVTPSVTATTLPGEVKRITTVGGTAAAADTIHLTVQDASADTYTVNSLALYLADGTLFAIYGQSTPILSKSSAAIFLSAADIKFASISATSITFGNTNFLNPPATTDMQGVVELATDAEATTGTDEVRAVTPGGLKAAVTSWLDARFGSGAPSAFIKGLLTSASATTLRASIGLGNAAVLNTGSGNNLDSDMLDGQHGSFYSDIASRLGFTPVQQGGGTGMGASKVYVGWNGSDPLIQVDTAAPLTLASTGKLGTATYAINGLTMKRGGVSLWGADNDGAGSGMDTDLFQGQPPSYYTAIVTRLGYTPVNKAGDNGLGTLSFLPGSVVGINASAASGGVQMVGGDSTHSGYVNFFTPANVRIGYVGFATNAGAIAYVNSQSAGHAFTGGQLTRDGSKVWDAGNDGAGSGMDTDLFQGHQLSEFKRVTSSGQNANGRWRKYSDGTIEMEGVLAINSGTNITTTHLTFPTAVDNGQLARVSGNADRPCNASWTPIACMFVGADATGCTVYTDSCNVSQAIASGTNVNWRLFTM